jgi:hypothetical protein
MILRGRHFASLEGEFAVFLIGMRINRPWAVHKWWPVASAMPRMLRELQAKPQLGMLGGQMWGGRTTLMVQYWRSAEQLFAFATDRDSTHVPAWRAFNRAIGDGAEVGVWHETYLVGPGGYENIYVNMPRFGLGRAGTLAPVGGGKQTARERLRPSSTPVT